MTGRRTFMRNVHMMIILIVASERAKGEPSDLRWSS